MQGDVFNLINVPASPGRLIISCLINPQHLHLKSLSSFLLTNRGNSFNIATSKDTFLSERQPLSINDSFCPFVCLFVCSSYHSSHHAALTAAPLDPFFERKLFPCFDKRKLNFCPALT